MTEIFEDLPCQEQELSFDTTNVYLARSIRPRYSLQGLKTEEGEYNNYALMLSDQCPWHFVIRTDMEEIELDGSLPSQIGACIDILSDYNPLIELDGRNGKFRRFPISAVKETLTNALIHFDPLEDYRIYVSHNSNRIKVESPGGFNSKSDYGRSHMIGPRNMKMGLMMVELGEATLTGRGLAIVRNNYSTSGMMPSIQKTKNRFIVRLPSLDSLSQMNENGKAIVLSFLRENRSALMSRISHELMISSH